MARNVRRRLALVTVFAALLVGGTAVALGATGSSSTPRHRRAHAHASVHRAGALLPAAAGYLGISTAELRKKLRSGQTLAQIAAATPGRTEAGLIAALLSAEQARVQTRTAQLPTRIKALVNAPGGIRAAARARRNSVREAVLSYLGLTRQQVARDMRSGKTLAQIADSEPGKSSSGLIEAILAPATQRLDAATASGQLSRSAESVRLAYLRARAAALVNRAHPAGSAH